MKNGKIELMRFIFALAILFRHINLKVYNLTKTIGIFSLGTRGYMGVEFFFLVSGFLMAKTIYNNIQKNQIVQLGSETFKFIYKKVKSILPYHVIVCILMAIAVCLLAPDKIPWKLIKKMPSVLLIQTTGILGDSSPLIAMEWYLSAMFLSMCVIYPLCRKNYNLYTRVIGPVLSIFIIGYLIKTTGYLSGTTSWIIFTMKGNLRAFAEINIGISCFEVYRYLKDFKLTRIETSSLKIIENICYVMALLYMFSNLETSFELHCFILLTIAVTLSFINNNKSSRLINNKLVYFLGAISLPIYLIQEIIWECVIHWNIGVTPKGEANIIFYSTILFGIILWLIVEKIIRRNKDNAKA